MITIITLNWESMNLVCKTLRLNCLRLAQSGTAIWYLDEPDGSPTFLIDLIDLVDSPQNRLKPSTASLTLKKWNLYLTNMISALSFET